ncbi:MAG TPA: mandelate racemase/muconate lactonizing enzyme family protein, partial [Candidatus Latescibacteria bacterium]|nr:mandelate racemase/muconate lactonizing enzyme family protein [Candidatus Latescibacterota bacterium]
MKITAIKTFMGVFGSRPRGLLKVETDEGIYGWGETYSIGPDLSIEPIADYIAKMIVGEDPRRIEYIMMKINQQYRFPPGGVGLAVSSAVDHALWDISGKAAGLPVYQLLGGTVRDRVRVYQGIGGKDGKQVAEHGQALNEKFGFTAFKT